VVLKEQIRVKEFTRET